MAQGAYDLANFFVLRTLGHPGDTARQWSRVPALLNQRGTACFIFPHKFFNSDSGAGFRQVLRQGRHVRQVAHFGANRVFHDADTYVAIALLQRQPTRAFGLLKLPYPTPPEQYPACLTAPAAYRPISYELLDEAAALYGDGANQWLLLDSAEEYGLLRELYAVARPSPTAPPRRLGEAFDIFVGIQTSHDKLYLLRIQAEDARYYYGHNELHPDEQVQVEKAWWRPMLRGRDVHRYARLHAGYVVFFPYTLEKTLIPRTGDFEDKPIPVPLSTLQSTAPYTAAYVQRYERDFKDREGGKSAFWPEWYRYLRENNLAEQLRETPRLSSMEICTHHPNVAWNDGMFCHSTTVYSWIKNPTTPETDACLLALANSRLLWWFLKRTGDTLQGDARRLKSNYLAPFPLPAHISAEHQAALGKLVNYLTWLHTPGLPIPDPTGAARFLQQVLDLCIFELYLPGHLRELELDVLRHVVAQALPLPPENGPDGAATAIRHVVKRWQSPDSVIGGRLQLAAVRSPHWLRPLFAFEPF